MNSEKLYNVYIHTNKINGKKYIGATSSAPNHRFANGAGYKQNKEFYSDIQKYGWAGFDHNIIYSGITKEQSHLKEQELIEKHNTTNSACGYNKRKGGIIPNAIIRKNGERQMTVSLNMDESLIAAISTLAKKHHRSRNGEILMAITKYLEHQENLMLVSQKKPNIPGVSTEIRNQARKNSKDLLTDLIDF